MKKLSTIILLTMSYLYSPLSLAISCDYGALLYDQGKYKRAYKVFLPLVKSQDACAEYYMGMMYYNGYYITADGKKADALFKSSAKHGYLKAKNIKDAME